MEEFKVRKLVLFDFDGVVADSFQVFYEEFSAVLLQLGHTRLASREAILKLFESNIITGLIKAGFPFYRLKQLAREFAPRAVATRAKILPFAGMPELLTTFSRRFPVYVVTSNLSEATRSFLERHAVEGVRDVLGADHESSKVKKIRQIRAKHPDHDAYYIGDTKGDMLEAAAAGAAPVAVTWGWHSEEVLREGAPRHVVHSPAELEALFMAPPAGAAQGAGSHQYV
ncbi:MAG: HAD hydrolase-like protein [Candidatus Hydrogenedentes bacterium]|nr:HAD hydrolase-like protein [Candidatus Hydrogenedentota bacterium]